MRDGPSATGAVTTADSGAEGRPRDPRRGLVLMFLGLALFSILNAVVKAQAEIFPVNQIVFFRNAGGAVALVAVLVWLREPLRIGRRRLPLNLLQMVVMTSGILLTFIAFHLMPLADVMAIGFTQPIVIALASALFLGERINRYGWAAIVLGLLGVQLVIMPSVSGSGLGLGALAAAAGMTCSAASMMLQRTMTAYQSPLFITFAFMTLSSFALLPTLLFSWVVPSIWQLAGLVAMGLASGPLQLVMVSALYHASAATVAPASYTNMIWAVLIGYFWFGDVPTVSVLAGSAVVIAATALLVRSVQRPASCIQNQQALPSGCVDMPGSPSTQSPNGRAHEAATARGEHHRPGR
jgi:drug/metabolite transporter (DMT)-like permease